MSTIILYLSAAHGVLRLIVEKIYFKDVLYIKA